MKIHAELPDLNQIFSSDFKDRFPFNTICRCMIDSVSGEIIKRFLGDEPIHLDKYGFDETIHDLGVYFPSFYSSREWNGENCRDRMTNVRASAERFDDLEVMPIFVRPDGSIRPYVILGLSSGVVKDGILRSIPYCEPTGNLSIDEFRECAREGRDPSKWGLMNQDMVDLIQFLYRLAFQDLDGQKTLGLGWNREEKPITGSTLVLGNKSGYVDPLNFGEDKPDARIKKVLSVVNGRLQIWNETSGVMPIKIANGKTLDQCIVEETDDYVIYSDGIVTEQDPIPSGIDFACRVDKHTGEIYIGEGYENLAKNSLAQGANGVTNKNTLEIIDYHTHEIKFTKNEASSYSNQVQLVTGGITSKLVEGELFICSAVLTELNNITGNWYLSTRGSTPPLSVKLVSSELKRYDIISTFTRANNSNSSQILILMSDLNFHGIETVRLKNIQITKTDIPKPFVRSKCPTGKMTIFENSSYVSSDFFINNQSINIHDKIHHSVSRDETNPSPELTSSTNLKIIPYRSDLSQEFVDMFADSNLYPFNLMGRYVVHKDTGEIIERLHHYDSTKSFSGDSSVFDPSMHDIHVLFFPFYANREWSGDILTDAMLFEIPTEVEKGKYKVMDCFVRPDGSIRHYVAYGAFKGSIVDGQLRSIPDMAPIVSHSLEQARGYARQGRTTEFNIENLDLISMVQFLFKITLQCLDSQNVIGYGYTTKTVSSLTGGSLSLGNRSGKCDYPFMLGERPDNSISACLNVVDGRLQYWNNPDDPMPIKIANGKTLDDCIVEETDDYVIYSDGEVTEVNPIPEGIDFACRVDKHTGEIYIGEGYTNLIKIPIHGDGYPGVQTFNQLGLVAGEKYVITTLVKNLDEQTIRHYDNNGSYVLEKFKTTFTSVQLTVPSISMASWGYELKNYTNLQNIVNAQITKTSVSKPYVKTKCPTGRLQFIKDTTILDKYSIIAKGLHNFKESEDIWNYNNWTIFLRNNPTTGVMVNSVGYKFYNDTSVGISKNGTLNSVTYNSGIAHATYQTYGIKFAPLINDNRRVVSLTQILIYQRPLSTNELVSEEAKNIVAISNYNVNNDKSTQISLFGIEDFYGNLFSNIDGCIVDDNGIRMTSDHNLFGNHSSYERRIRFTPPMGEGVGERRNGYVKSIQKLDSFVNYPNETSSSSNEWYGDYHWSHSRGGTERIVFGADFDDGPGGGVFYVSCQPLSNTDSRVTSRLTIIP